MQLFDTISTLQEEISLFKKKHTIGFVPTMGALHQGHLSLIQQAKKNTDIIVVSIFVNPTQFDNKEDLDNYPITLENDLKLLKSVGCDIVFTPSIKEIYADTIRSKHFDFGSIAQEMEGKFRNGHFDGVGTIVNRLFDIIQPDKAFFGEKDFQQLQIIKKLVEIENKNIEIIGCPIFRELDGLAMSSRNERLTPAYRKAAPFIFETLQKVQQKFDIKNAVEITNWVKEMFDKHPILELEYFTIANESDLKTLTNEIQKNQTYRAFIAVFAGDIRLIDNIDL